MDKEKLIERLKKRHNEFLAAQQAANNLQQLAGAVNEIAILLIDEFGMTKEEIDAAFTK